MTTTTRHLSERDVKSACLAWLDLLVVRGLLVYLDRPSPKPGTSKEGMLHVVGGPDVVGLIKRQVPFVGGGSSATVSYMQATAIEYKKPGGKLRPEQEKWRDKWEALGGLYLVVDSLDSQVKQFEAVGLPTVGEVQI